MRRTENGKTKPGRHSARDEVFQPRRAGLPRPAVREGRRAPRPLAARPKVPVAAAGVVVVGAGVGGGVVGFSAGPPPSSAVPRPAAPGPRLRPRRLPRPRAPRPWRRCCCGDAAPGRCALLHPRRRRARVVHGGGGGGGEAVAGAPAGGGELLARGAPAPPAGAGLLRGRHFFSEIKTSVLLLRRVGVGSSPKLPAPTDRRPYRGTGAVSPECPSCGSRARPSPAPIRPRDASHCSWHRPRPPPPQNQNKLWTPRSSAPRGASRGPHEGLTGSRVRPPPGNFRAGGGAHMPSSETLLKPVEEWRSSSSCSSCC